MVTWAGHHDRTCASCLPSLLGMQEAGESHIQEVAQARCTPSEWHTLPTSSYCCHSLLLPKIPSIVTFASAPHV